MRSYETVNQYQICKLTGTKVLHRPERNSGQIYLLEKILNYILETEETQETVH